MQDSALRPGSIPGPPITDVFVAVRHRSVTNNNNYPAACISEKKAWCINWQGAEALIQ